MLKQSLECSCIIFLRVVKRERKQGRGGKDKGENKSEECGYHIMGTGREDVERKYKAAV